MVALTSQQHASVYQGRICTDNFTCCHTETEAADQTFHLTQSQYTDTGPTSPSADPIRPISREEKEGNGEKTEKKGRNITLKKKKKKKDKTKEKKKRQNKKNRREEK